MVQVLIDDVDYSSYVRQASIQMDDKLSDPVPTLQFDLEDPQRVFSFRPYQSVVILDDTQPSNPTHNLYPDALYATQANVTTADGTITYNGTAGTATFAVSSPGSPTGTLMQTETVQVHASQTYTFSIYRNISSISHCTVFLTTTVLKADGSTASTATDTFTTTSGGTVRYSKTVTLPSTARFLTVTYGVQSIISTSACNAVFSHAQIEMQRTGQTISYPTPDCVPGATSCTQLPDLTTVRETRLWAGYLLIATAQYFGTQRLWSLQASGIACLLSKQVATSYAFASDTDEVLVLSLVAGFLAGLVSASPTTVLTSQTTLPALAGSNSYVKDIFDSWANQCGTVYWVDAYGQLHWQIAGSIAASFTLSDSPDMVTSFPYYNYTYEFDASQMINEIYVLGQEQTRTLTYSASPATGNGSNKTFYVGTGDIQTITVAGTATTAYTYYSSGYVVFTSAPANGAAVQVTIKSTFLPTAARRLALSVATYNIVLQGAVQDSAITTADDAAARAHLELETYALGQGIITLTTNQAILAGQRVSFTNTFDGFSGVDLLVQAVQTTLAGTNELGTQILEYTCTLGPYRADFVHQILFLQRQLTSQASDVSLASFTVADWEPSTLTVSDAVSVVTTTTPNLQGTDTFFVRFGSGSFGTASDGQTWTTNQSSGSPLISVTGTEGQVVANASSSFAEFLLGTKTVRNVDITVRVGNAPFFSTGNTVTTNLLFQAINNTNRYFVSLTSTDGSSTSTLALKKTVSGVTTTIASTTVTNGAPTGWTYYGTAGFLWMRLHGSNGSFTVKCWIDGQTEPQTPQITASDSSLTGAGKFGVSFTLPGDSASSCQVDSFTVIGV